MDALQVGKKEYSDFCEVSDDLIERILAWLPLEYVYKFRTVCRQWNAIFSSPIFISKQWAEAPPNKNPWLLVGNVYSKNCWPAYSSYTQSWKISCFSLSILNPAPPRHSHYPPIQEIFEYLGSGAGLFLIKHFSANSIYICNPVTQECFTLPPITYAKRFIDGEMCIVQEGENGYRVLAVYPTERQEQNIVEIYDSTERAWRMAGVLPLDDLLVLQSGTVFSGGYFYFVVVVNRQKGIMGFGILEGTSIFVPFPDLFHDGRHVHFIRLVACGSRILCVAAMFMAARMSEEVIIWEFNKDAATNWEEIARMPPTLYPSNLSFQCAGIGDCLYFKTDEVDDVAVYNFTQNSWTLLPTCPKSANYNNHLIAFKPVPNMRVR